MGNFREIFFNNQAQTSSFPPAIEITGGDGCYVSGTDYKKYIDFISGISVSSMGHQNVLINDAIKSQLESHLHVMVYGEYILSPQVKLISELCAQLPENLQNIFLTNSGTEATEGAMKLAKRFTGRTEIISFRNSYHGSTQGSLSICGNEELKNSFRPLLPGNRILEFNEINQLQYISEETAAVFIEPVQAEAGIILPAEGFMIELRKICNRKNVLLVFDEIQTGFYRTGSLFAYEQSGVIPDILLIGKAFGGGLPLGAFISSKKIMNALAVDPMLGHLTTTGGHPLSCAAAFASLKQMLEPGFGDKILATEKLIRSLLVHQHIKDLRGRGLLLAIEFDSEMINQKVIQRCFEKGLLTDWFLFAPACLRIAPPLITPHEVIRDACKIILEAIDFALH